jgi:tetratricopeptide (TPR) repeat protein
LLDENEKLPNTPSPDEESTGHAALDKRLATGVLRGDSGTDTAQVWISAFLVAALGFIVYLGSFSIPLHGDDLALFHESKALQRIVTAPGAMELLPTSPLSVIALAVGRAATGGGVDGLHGLSILLHLCSAVLLYLIARRLLPSGTPEAVAMLAGMLFVAHPVVTGAVNYLAAFPVLLSTFFGLLALNLLLRGAAQANLCVGSLAGAIIGFVLAFGSDTSALLLPVLGLAILHLRAVPESNAKYLRMATPVLTLTVALCWVTGQASGLFDPAIVNNGVATRIAAFLDAGGNLLLSVFWPLRTPVLPVSPGLVAGLAAVVVLAVLLAAGILRRQSLVLVGAVWALLALFSVACYAPSELVGSMRYLYLPFAGLALLLPWGLTHIPAPSAFRVAGGAAAVLILVLGFLSYQCTATWIQPDLLWRAEAERQPNSVEPLRALGRFQSIVAQLAPADDAEYKERLCLSASEAWKVVLSRVPGDVEAEKNAGMMAANLGKLEEALPLLESASTKIPEDQEVALYLALTLEQSAAQTGDRERVVGALRAFRRAASLGVIPPEAQGRYGMLSASFGDLDTGLPLLRAAMGGDDQSPLKAPFDQFSKLAEQLQVLGQRAEAAMTQNPQGVEGALIRAERLLLEGRTMSAFYFLQLVMRQSEGNDAAWAMLGFVSARIEGSQNFLNEWGASRVGNTAAWEQLAMRCGLSGSWDAAERYLRHGLSGVAGAMPEMKLAGVALQARQAERALAYLDAAQKAYPESPAPWLQLADMSIATQNLALARTQLDEAEKRGATPDDIKARRDKLGAGADTPSGIQRTVIR